MFGQSNTPFGGGGGGFGQTNTTPAFGSPPAPAFGAPAPAFGTFLPFVDVCLLLLLPPSICVLVQCQSTQITLLESCRQIFG